MITTTTNTTTRSLEDIMRTAHELTQRSIAKNPGDSYRATFAAALRVAWSETGRSAAEIWAIYTDAEKYDTLQRMTARAYQMRDARATKDGRSLPNLFAWIDPRNVGDDLRAVAHDAYLRLAALLDDPSRADMPLSRLLYAAVLAAAQAIGRAEKRNGSALKTVTGSDGQPLNVIDRLDVLGARAPDPYAATITRAAIDAAAADDIDRVIIACLAAGYSRRETAARVGMTHGAVNYRVGKIRDRYNAG